MRKSGMFYRIRVLAIWVLIISGLAGCVKSGSSYSNSTSSGVTFISLMNLASYSTDVYLNGSKASQPTAPGYYDLRYGQLKPGAYDIQFKLTGTDSLLAEIPSSLYDSLNFNTVILYNRPGTTAINAVKIADNFSTLSVSAANYRFFNMCPDAPSVDLYFNTTATQAARTTADNVNNTGYNAFQTATPGIYNLQVKKAGTDSVVATLNGATLAAGTASTIFLQGHAGNTSNPVSLTVLVASY